MRALISLYDKTGLRELADGLRAGGYELVASGGTSRELTAFGIPHLAVEDLTGYPQLFGGRVKTLHPAVHGPILARRNVAEDMEQLSERGWEPIDVVVVNLYPFSSDPGVELIDIGGPAMVRAAAKNFQSVAVVVDPADYPALLERIPAGIDVDFRRYLAARAFAYVSAYDREVAGFLNGGGNPIPPQELVAQLRYGENPHQEGYLYRPAGEPPSGWAAASWQGAEPPSYLNIFDADGAMSLLETVGSEPAAVIVKHGGPCGVAVADDIVTAYERAFDGDPLSAFGGVVALNRPLDTDLAEAILARPKADVIVVPGFSEEALQRVLAKRKRSRIAVFTPVQRKLSVRSVAGGLLIQGPDQIEDAATFQLMTSRRPTEAELQDAWLAVAVVRASASNAVVIVKGREAVGVGQGQPSRVDAARIAVEKGGPRVVGAAAASDAFFPFPDGLLALADAGVTTVVAPSGSIRDAEIVKVAEEAGISLLFSPRRHFRH